MLARALVAADVKVYRQRKVGTLRLLPFYAKGSEQRARAEALAKAAKADGVKAASVAAGVSLVTGHAWSRTTRTLVASPSRQWLTSGSPTSAARPRHYRPDPG